MDAEHTYSDDGTLTGFRYVVAVVTEVQDDDRPKDNGRRVWSPMTSDVARQRAAELIEAADRADEANAHL
jgi:hypothetical protein